MLAMAFFRSEFCKYTWRAASLESHFPKFRPYAQAALPVRWTRRTVDGALNWTVSTAFTVGRSKSAYTPDPFQFGENEMVSPAFRVSTPNGRLTFRNWYEFETTFLRNRLYDGSVLEIKIGNGPWADIIAAGGLFESGGYDGLLDTCCSNPLGGRPNNQTSGVHHNCDPYAAVSSRKSGPIALARRHRYRRHTRRPIYR